MAQPSTIRDRLLAHARLCREIAGATMSEETAAALERLAADCVEAAQHSRSGAAAASNNPQLVRQPPHKRLI